MTNPTTTPAAGDAESTEKVDLKNPWLAAILSWAVPGAGQLYQGRFFKGFTFLFCILGMFLCGVQMGEGHPVYTSYYVASEGQVMKKRNYGYLSQMLVGTAAMPAIFQAGRFSSPDNNFELDQAITANCQATVTMQKSDVENLKLQGTIELTAQPGPLGTEVIGTFQGTVDSTGETVELELKQYPPNIGFPAVSRKIAADSQRQVYLQVAKVKAGPDGIGDNFQGAIPRPFLNWFQVPMQDRELQDMNARLGKHWELAMVLTWIAGLLNILSIWDALEGPAYGIRPRKFSTDNKPNPA